MQSKPIKTMTSLTFCLLAAVTPVNAAGETLQEDVIARVGDGYITRSRLGHALVHTVGPEVMDQFLHVRVIEFKAASRGISVSESELAKRLDLEVKKRLEDIFEQNRMVREEFRIHEASGGAELQSLKARVRDSIAEEELRVKLKVEKMLADRIKISEQELQRQFRWRYGRRLAASHILLPDEETALEVHGYLERNPDNWEAMVGRFSHDRRSIEFGGRLLPFPADTELGTAFENREPGELFVHRTERGWHVMKLLNVFDQAVPSVDHVRERIWDELAVRKVENMLPGWFAEVFAETEIREPDDADGEVLFYLNGQAVKRKEFGDMLVEQFGMVYLERVAEMELVRQLATDRGLTVPDDALEGRMELLTEFIFIAAALDRGVTASGLEDHLLSDGLLPGVFRLRLQRRFLHADGVKAMLEAEAAAAAMMAGPDKDAGEIGELYRGRRLVVQRLVRSRREEAQSLRSEAQAGGNFSRLVLLQSDDPLAWLSCGLVWDVTGEHRYYRQTKGLAPGEYSEVFAEAGGFVFLRLLHVSEPGEKCISEAKEGVNGPESWHRSREARHAIPELLEKLMLESRIEL